MNNPRGYFAMCIELGIELSLHSHILCLSINFIYLKVYEACQLPTHGKIILHDFKAPPANFDRKGSQEEQ